jgi:hypothetical protein
LGFAACQKAPVERSQVLYPSLESPTLAVIYLGD